MGGWKLEVGKMMIYMAFPVGLFHYFNQPENFEEWVLAIKNNSYHPKQKKEDREAIENFIVERRRSDDEKLLKALENSSK